MAAHGSALSNYLKKVLLFGGGALCLIAVFAAVWSRVGRQTHTFTFRLGPPGTEVAAADLRRAGQVLQGRLAALRREFRLGACAVRALPPDRVEMTFTCDGDPTEPVAWLTLQGKAEFRLLHPQDDVLERAGPEGLGPDYEVKVYRERRYLHVRLNEMRVVEQRYAVEREPVLTVGEFAGVTMDAVGLKKNVVLTFRFKEADARAFAATTALHAGRWMALLIDGEMFFPPKRIESAVAGGSVQVSGFFRIPTQRRLARVLDCGSLPQPLVPVPDPGADAGG